MTLIFNWMKQLSNNDVHLICYDVMFVVSDIFDENLLLGKVF